MNKSNEAPNNNINHTTKMQHTLFLQERCIFISQTSSLIPTLQVHNFITKRRTIGTRIALQILASLISKSSANAGIILDFNSPFHKTNYRKPNISLIILNAYIKTYTLNIDKHYLIHPPPLKNTQHLTKKRDNFLIKRDILLRNRGSTYSNI